MKRWTLRAVLTPLRMQSKAIIESASCIILIRLSNCQQLFLDWYLLVARNHFYLYYQHSWLDCIIHAVSFFTPNGENMDINSAYNEQNQVYQEPFSKQWEHIPPESVMDSASLYGAAQSMERQPILPWSRALALQIGDCINLIYYHRLSLRWKTTYWFFFIICPFECFTERKIVTLNVLFTDCIC